MICKSFTEINICVCVCVCVEVDVVVNIVIRFWLVLPLENVRRYKANKGQLDNATLTK